MKYLMQTLVSLVLMLPVLAGAAASDWPMEPMTPDLRDQPSLQNGWRIYNNYFITVR